MNTEQIQYVVDGLVENRKSIEEKYHDLYDSLVMDLLEQLEGQGYTFPTLVLGEEEQLSDEQQDEMLQLREQIRLMGGKFNLLINSMEKDAPFHEQKIKLCKAGLDNVYEAFRLMFGEEEADVLTGRDRQEVDDGN